MTGSTEHDATPKPTPQAPTPTPARVRRIERAAAGQVWLEVEAPVGFVDRHTTPGQYCSIGLPGGETMPFALRSTPGEETLLFLVREMGLGEGLAALAVGGDLIVGPPSGNGFALGDLLDRELVFVASGTGLAPIRAAIRALLDSGRQGTGLRLFCGLRGPDWIAEGEELSRFREAGVQVTMAYSLPHGDAPGVYVQDVVSADLAAEGEPAERLAFVVAGHPPMVQAIRDLARRFGDDIPVRLNF